MTYAIKEQNWRKQIYLKLTNKSEFGAKPEQGIQSVQPIAFAAPLGLIRPNKPVLASPLGPSLRYVSRNM